jgi:gluconate 2-dehydrogenase alpha chain
MTYAGTMFATACEEFGYKAHVNPIAAQTQAYMNPYKLMLGQCIRGGFCTSHACSQGAKANPSTTVIPALLKQENCEIRPLSNVIRVNLDSDRKRATGVTYLDASGREFEQPADIVVLGAYTFNNVRLMLLSGIGTPYDPVANRGVVGRNYSYQSHGRVTMFFEEKAFNPFMGARAHGDR